jgi:hypothetical protein
MPRAVVLTTAYKANATGGTFADALAANSGDSLSVSAFTNGGARVLEAWAIDSDSVCEIEWFYTRPQSTADQVHGLRSNVPAENAAFNLMQGKQTIEVFSSDTPTINVSASAADDIILSYLTEYDDLPGVTGTAFATPEWVESNREATIGINSQAAAGTVGVYGTASAINADDDRFIAGKWYAIWGVTVQTQVTTIAVTGPDWGNYKIGIPAGALYLNSSSWFADQSLKWGKPMIPCFQANNKASTFVYVADGEASTTPDIDFFLYQLSNGPGGY